jgi:hypothetical protein
LMRWRVCGSAAEIFASLILLAPSSSLRDTG